MSDPPMPPQRPVLAVLAVVVHDGRWLMVRRAHPPDAGFWGFPGGKVEAGERLQDAALRELHEETGVTARAGRVLTALDAMDRDAAGALRHHHVLVAVLCHWQHGTPTAAADALEAAWLDEVDLADGRPLSRDVAMLARMAAQG